MKCKKTRLQKSILLFICLTLEIVFTYLFYNQVIGMNTGRFASDLPIHILLGMQGGNYSIIYYVISTLFSLRNGAFFVGLFFATIVMLNFYVTALFVDKYFDVDFWGGIITAFVVTFLGKIYLPIDSSDYIYYEILDSRISFSLITQPWHNITYSAMRLVVVLILIFFYEIAQRYLESFKLRDWLILSSLMALSAAIKPSFMLCFSVAILIMLIIDFVKGKPNIKKFVSCTKMATTVLPSFVIMFIQSFVLFGDESGAGTSMSLVIKDSCLFELGIKRTCFILLTCFAFPVLVWLYNLKNKEHKKNRLFTDILLLVALLEVIFLRETGVRKYDYNLLWTVFGASYVLYMVYIPLFIENIKSKGNPFSNKGYFLAASILLCANFVCGMWYFIFQLCGNGYIL